MICRKATTGILDGKHMKCGVTGRKVTVQTVRKEDD
jgi:hypothetical protein